MPSEVYKEGQIDPNNEVWRLVKQNTSITFEKTEAEPGKKSREKVILKTLNTRRRNDLKLSHFELKINHQFLFYAGYRLYPSLDATEPIIYHDSPLSVFTVLSSATALVGAASSVILATNLLL